MRSTTVLAGSLALAALSALPATAQPPPAPLAYVQPLPGPAVQSVQERLRQAGVYAGRIDGVWGADSQAALERFQQAHQLQVTGQLNQATAATLGLDPSALLTMPPHPHPRRPFDGGLGAGRPGATADARILSRRGGRRVGGRYRSGARELPARPRAHARRPAGSGNRGRARAHTGRLGVSLARAQRVVLCDVTDERAARTLPGSGKLVFANCGSPRTPSPTFPPPDSTGRAAMARPSSRAAHLTGSLPGSMLRKIPPGVFRQERYMGKLLLCATVLTGTAAAGTLVLLAGAAAAGGAAVVCCCRSCQRTRWI